jgi:hypothetical protein
VHYEYWRHKALPEIYAVRLEGRQVTGVAGPLPEATLDSSALPHYVYDDDPERYRRLEHRENGFLPMR